MSASIQSHFDKYISYCINTKGLRPKTIRSYQNLFSIFRSVMPEVDTLDDISHGKVDDFFLRLRTRPKRIGNTTVQSALKASTVRTYGTKLYAFFNWLCERDLLTKNPINKRSLPSPDYSDKRALVKSDIEKIFGAVTQCSQNTLLFKRDMAILQVLLFCGLRKNELLSLRVMDVDLGHKQLTVNGETSKSKSSRKLPITDATILHLHDYLSERRKRQIKSEYLWVSRRGERLTEHGLLHWVKKTRAASGVRFHLHQFRHTYACMLGRGNVSGVKIRKLLGHRSLEMTQSYLRSLGVDDVRDSVQALSLDSL